MQIIIISPSGKKHTHLNLSYVHGFVACFAIVALVFAYFSVAANDKLDENSSNVVPSFVSEIEPSLTTEQYELKLDDIHLFYAQRIGQLQAEAIRLSALTAKLADFAGLDISEFSLDEPAAQGGVEHEGVTLEGEAFNVDLIGIEKSFGEQSKQLMDLERYLLTQDSITSAIPDGRPIESGWISSFYGKRIDPFSGKRAFHHGLDFAAKAGSKVISVADGIVSWTGRQNGYGEMIDIDHGNGYVTRYAHNKKVIVHVGDKITKGQTIALVGSTGRSTGPHVHFEVIKDGKSVNPYKYVKR
jgi:murein DD-endopeptidase MepM/ murein hydrolase activator NlpD